MPQTTYDLVVIGSGPAGQKAALNAAKLGKRVALIDRTDSVGGVCIHTGTIPSKAMREAVLHLTGMHERSVYGDSYAVKQRHHDGRICCTAAGTWCGRRWTSSARRWRATACRCSSATQRSSTPHTVRVVRDDEATELQGEATCSIAVGTEPARPANVPFTPGRVIDSNELLDLADLPQEPDHRRRRRDRDRVRLHAGGGGRAA